MPDPTPHEPNNETRKKVISYYAVGVPQGDIAAVLGIDPKTLRKYYRKELDESLVKANAAVGGALFEKAKGGDTSAIIWWEKTRAGKSDKSAVDLTSNGQTINSILGLIDGQSKDLPSD